MARDFDEEARDNAGRLYAYEFDWTIRAALLRRWRPWISEGDTLEVGAYQGEMTEQILSLVPQLEILEPSRQLSHAISARFPGRVKVHSLAVEEADFPPRFRLIFLVHTLEHLDDPVDALRRMGSWLTADGVLLVAVPNANALSRQIAVHMGLIAHPTAVTDAEYAHGHRRTYTLETLQSDVTEAGLVIDTSGGAIVKPLSNGQFDSAIRAGIISEAYVRACDELADKYPDLVASIFVVCRPG